MTTNDNTTAHPARLTDEQILAIARHHFRAGHDPKAEPAFVAAVRECLAAPAAPAPQGWKLVPVEPTQEMATAYLSLSMKSWRQSYIAMLDAAPAAPASAPAAQASKCATCNDNGMIGGPSYYAPDEGGEPCPDCAAPAPAAQADRESALDQAMAERDAYQTIADGMAYGIAKRFGIDIGEHSNLNFPWDNALQILEDEPFPQSAPADAASEAMSQAARDVLAERQRQISAEGWTPEHDDKFTNGALSLAAGTYALHGPLPTHGNVPLTWPWDHDGWKPSTPRRNLVKAGALILAEIERMDRAANTAAIAANYAVNSQRAESIARAVSAHGRHWPEQLTSGVMFYEGERITKAEFLAALRGAEG